MKRVLTILISLVLLLSIASCGGSTTSSKTTEKETTSKEESSTQKESESTSGNEEFTPGTVHITFIRNKVPETVQNIGLHTWGCTPGGALEAKSSNADGTIWKFEVQTEEGKTSMGFIPALFKEDNTPDWDNKLSYGGADLSIDYLDVANGGDLHVVLFENAKVDEYVSKVVEGEQKLAFVGYYAAAYEENLGVHNWGWLENAGGWGDPLHIFETIGHAGDGSDIKGGLLIAADAAAFAGAGLLTYAGGDDSKKHPSHGDGGNIAVSNGDYVDYETNVLNLAFVNGGEVYAEAKDFIENAFLFKLVDMYKTKVGELAGTFALNPTQVSVQASAAILVPTVKTAATDDAKEVLYTTQERQAMLNAYFTVTDSTGTALEIERVDGNLSATDGTNSFVVVLKSTSQLDNTKEYTIKFEQGLVMAELGINMDSKAPIITLTDPTLAEQTIPFDSYIETTILPAYIAIDDRDGTITNIVYVKEGQGVVDTTQKQTWVVKLTVVDNWGNETQLELNFIVE